MEGDTETLLERLRYVSRVITRAQRTRNELMLELVVREVPIPTISEASKVYSAGNDGG